MSENQAWMIKAACRHLDTNLFFTERGDHKTLITAMQVCNGTDETPACPVKQQCLDWAMSFGQEDNWGVFGGVPASVRIKMRRKENKKKPKKRAAKKEVAPKPELESQKTLTPFSAEWRASLSELLRLIHHTTSRAENDRRARKGFGPVAIEIRN